MKRAMLPCILFAAVAAFAADAAEYPVRPVRIVVPVPAGSGADIVLREIAQKLPIDWGQQVVVDNRPGANGIIGMGLVAQSKPDGYTLLYGFTSVLTVNRSIYKSVPYDTLRDFAPITQTVTNTIALVVNPYLPVRSVKQLVALGRSRPGDLLYASAGIGNVSHLTAVLFEVESGLKMLHVPYKGTTPALTELISGQNALIFTPLAGAASHIRSGRLRLLATCGTRRSTVFPGTPTMIESGFPKVISVGWGGLLAPAGTPPDIVRKVHRDTARVLALSEMRDRLGSMGADAESSTPEEFAAWIKSETEKWGRVVRSANLFHSQ
ncbi:MAG: tripartite tricarboxylate transporter substrate binding protein [Betaproteobacteria bacterium]|nr:tripartite tricarboxylate transporter substrate binding protein [Betaproteobacteria bacterium]